MPRGAVGPTPRCVERFYPAIISNMNARTANSGVAKPSPTSSSRMDGNRVSFIARVLASAPGSLTRPMHRRFGNGCRPWRRCCTRTAPDDDRSVLFWALCIAGSQQAVEPARARCRRPIEMSLLCQIKMTLPDGFTELAYEPSVLKRARSNNGSGFLGRCIGRRVGAALRRGSAPARRPTPTMVTSLSGRDGDISIWRTQAPGHRIKGAEHRPLFRLTGRLDAQLGAAPG